MTKKSLPISRILEIYYLLTFIFIFADWFFNLNVRVVAIEDPLYRGFWYGGCLLLGFIIHWRPEYAIFVGLIESSANLILLILLTAIKVMVVDVDAVEKGEIYFTKSTVINFIISGTICFLIYEKAKVDFKNRFF